MAFTDYEREKIREAYRLSKGNAAKAARMCRDSYDFGFLPADSAIKRMCKNLEGVTHLEHGGHRNGLTQEQFEAIYKECKGDIATMMKRAGYTRPRSLVKRCEEAGFTYSNVPEEPSRGNGSELSVRSGRVLTDMVGVSRLSKGA